MTKNLSEVKGLKPLKPRKKPQKYDALINEIRAVTGVPMNAALLSRMAVDAYVKKYEKPKGGYDLIGMTGAYADIAKEKKRIRETKNLEARLEKLKEKQKKLEALLKK